MDDALFIRMLSPQTSELNCELYTGQILDLEVEGNSSRDRQKKCRSDAIKDDLRQWNLHVETCLIRREWRKRLKTSSHIRARRVT